MTESDLARDLEALAADLKRLEAEYSMFFAGRRARPPWETRARVEAVIRRWDRGYIQSAADRFRFSSLQARFAKMSELWDRALRAREEGRPGPLAPPAPKAPPPPRAQPARVVLCAASIADPDRERKKLLTLYESLTEARHRARQPAVPFDRFEALVRNQVERLRGAGSPRVDFQVVMEEGKVSFKATGRAGRERRQSRSPAKQP
ncbi:MAG TPA: MXAN_5187 C-terminal domain-containing protein [Vicinamibacterales bacterium]|nr:MXAN_5187 C-terminal domain-containing protein [Vicinamibacterales bacterium]